MSYLFIPFLAGLALLQSSAMPYLAVLNVKPDLVLVAVVGWGMVKGVHQALLWGIWGGLLLDLFSSAPLGVSVLALAPVAILTATGRTKLVENRLLFALASAFLATFIYYFLFLLILQTTGSRVVWLASLTAIFLPAAIVNTILTPFAFWFLQWLDKRANPIL